MSLDWIRSTPSLLAREDIVIVENGQTEIELDIPYIVGINMIDVYLNGILQEKGVFQEVSSTGLLYTDAENPLQEGDIITVRHNLAEGITIGDLRIVSSYAELFNLPSVQFNTIAIVTELKRFYHYGHNGWEEWNIPFTTKNLGILFNYEKQTITDNSQTTYVLNDITYNPGMNDLLVFINGLLVKDYTEVDNRTITFDYDELPDGEIEFLVANTDPWEDCNNHTVFYTYDDDLNVNGETVMYDEHIIRATQYEYDSKGNIIRETITKNLKKIVKDYVYNEYGDIETVSVSITSV